MLLGMASVWRHPESRFYCLFRKRAQRLADEYEKASRIKRTLKQAQAVLDRLHEELSGEKVARPTLRKHLHNWLEAKEGATAPATMVFYRKSLAKFIEFLGPRSDQPITEITKQDIVAFRNKLATQVAARTANHDLKTLKMLFKSARRDSVVIDDPAEFAGL